MKKCNMVILGEVRDCIETSILVAGAGHGFMAETSLPWHLE